MYHLKQFKEPQFCLALECRVAIFSQCYIGVPKSSKFWKNVVFPGVPLSNLFGYVREEVSYFIQPFLLFIVLYYRCNSTHLAANFFELISETHPSLSDALFTSFL